MNLSKSKYCSAVQCPKILWLKKNRPELFDEGVLRQSVLDTGSAVGDLAMGLFGDFTEVPFGDLSEMLRITQQLLDDGTATIAEASFSYRGCFCSVDILRNLGEHRVELYEVKSSTGVHDIYLHDVAYQVRVLTGLGYQVEKACLVHIDNTYVRHGDLELQKLFKAEDLTETAAAMGAEVEARIAALEPYLQQTQEPEQAIGLQCFRPYDCGFFGYCGRDLPQPNVFDLAGVQLDKKVECCDQGIVSFEALRQSGKFNAKACEQLDFSLQHLPPKINKDGIRQLLGQLSYPLYFLDFESFQPAVPQFDDSKPFQQIVFQYSLHYIEHEGGELKHTEFLAEPGGDPRRALAEQLCRDIPPDVCTTAYNMAFEKTRIKELAALYPDLSDHLMNICEHIVDLMIPFRNRDYYCEAMQGSYSIKYVLPALYPDDPALDYHNLEQVHNGGEASATFEAMAAMSPEARERTRKNLLKYCGLDTFALVKVWEKLKQAAE